MTIAARTCALSLAMSVATPACTSRRPTDGNDVDLNAAAAMAEQDIANYAAERKLARHRHAGQPLAAPATR